jgi:general secretion pathway protein E
MGMTQGTSAAGEGTHGTRGFRPMKGRMAKPLRLRPAHGRGKPIELTGAPVTMGRHPDNTICIRSERASRQHCVIEAAGPGEFQVRDLASRNGVKVNGERVEIAPLRAGDVLRVAGEEFLVEASGPEASAAPIPSEDGDDWAAANPAWLGELRRTLRDLPPKREVAERVTLLSADGQPSEVLGQKSEGPTAWRYLLRIASKARATDIHLEPRAESFHVRMRVDGQMVWIGEIPVRVGELMVGVVRAICQFKAVARDAVQDGHFSAKFDERRVEFRVSLTPTVHGPKGVLRVLDGRDIPHALEEMGLVPYMHERIRRATRQDQGLLLVCGPTGSGKTTTLYNALREIDRSARNVVTIEDPVEYTIEGTTQLPVDEEKGKGFGDLLRSVLRQDPDVILVGEIRDEPTARTAMQAAMTGHLVFSTVHAKDSIAAVFRLLDLKVEPYLVASSLDLVLAQRLVRTLCPACKREVPLPPGEAARLGRFSSPHMSVPVGCKACLATGYRGRTAIFELLDVTDDLRDIILREPSIQAMKKVIEAGHFTTLAQSGWRLVSEGLTSLEEVDRVAGLG